MFDNNPKLKRDIVRNIILREFLREINQLGLFGNSEDSPFQMSIKKVPKPFTIFHF
jgi:hypothetical protein